MEFLVIWLIVGGVLGCVGAWVAAQKNRPGGEGFMLGFFLGPLGLILEALLPTLTKEQLAELQRRPEPPSPAELAARKAKEQAYMEAFRQERERNRKAAEETRRRRAESFSKACHAVFGFSWFHALPDWMQPIFLGIAVALPVVAIIALAFH